MLLSLSLIFLLGLALAYIFKLIKLPRLIGLLLTGIILGPYVLDLINPKILDISTELRKIALIIILIKAGLSLDIKSLKKVGLPAVLLSFLPASFEILGILIFGPLLFNISYMDALVIGAVLGAVSPAVVVPKMVELMEKKYGTNKSIPELILAGSSLDDVYVIVLFTAFLGIEKGSSINVMTFVNIPLSIIIGIALGVAVGVLLYLIFEFMYKHNMHVKNSFKIILILALSFLMVASEELLEGIIPLSGLLSVMSMSMVLGAKYKGDVGSDLSTKYSKLWLAFEILLFVLVGGAVNINYALNAGFKAVILIFVGLLFRSVGTYLCLFRCNLNIKEKLFIVLSYIPKATVQAAIGGIALSEGLACGELVLSIAVVSILITAPLGAILMDFTYKKLLTQEIEIEE